MSGGHKSDIDDAYDGIQINFPSDSNMNSTGSFQKLLPSFSTGNMEPECDSRSYHAQPQMEFWTSLFRRQFLSDPKDNSCDGPKDDLLFYVRKVFSGNSCKVQIEVFRRNSSRLPSLYELSIEWEETVYLNIIMQNFVYIVTVGVCTKTGPQEMQILRKFSREVYASPSRRKMDSKGTEEEIVYPNIFFTLDNFEEIFSDCVIRDSESICVELTAYDRYGNLQGVIFLGSIRYDALKLVYDRRTSSQNSSSVWHLPFSWGSDHRVEFIRMRGPHGKGHAEMAVKRVRNSDQDGDSGNTTPVPSRYQSHNNLFWKSPSMQASHHASQQPAPSATLPRSMRTHVTNGSRKTSTSTSESNNHGSQKTVSASANTSPSREWKHFRRQSESQRTEADHCGESQDPGYTQSSSTLPMYNKRSTMNASSHQLYEHNRNGSQSSYSHHPSQPKQSSWWSGSLKKAASESSNIDRVGIRGHDEVQAYHVQEDFDSNQSGNLPNSWSRSFGQAWYWFKEKRRNTSVALNVYLTYITLPWYRIITDVLEVRQQPILTFDVE